MGVSGCGKKNEKASCPHQYSQKKLEKLDYELTLHGLKIKLWSYS